MTGRNGLISSKKWGSILRRPRKMPKTTGNSGVSFQIVRSSTQTDQSILLRESVGLRVHENKLVNVRVTEPSRKRRRSVRILVASQCGSRTNKGVVTDSGVPER